MSQDHVNITIDGIKVTARPGQTVLEAAIEAGIYIPYLCYHPGMKPFAACRMCVVEVENGRGYPAACTLPATDGMVVKNTSDEVYDLRRNVMEMLIADHPHGCLTCHRVDLCGPQDVCLRHVSVNDRCVTCPKNERCELKDTVRHLGMELESPLEYKYRDLPVDTGDPFYDRDYNLCIVCGRCVRVCEEIRGDNAITFTERGGQALIGTSFGSSLLESGCEFCGACLDVCPVGALVESEHKWEKARHVERTVCPHCPVGCQLNLEVNKFGKVIRSIPEINSPSNRGQACFKGKFGLDYVNHKDRLKTPLVRRNGNLEEASWQEAMDLVLRAFENKKGSSFAMLTSPNSTNEEHYLAQKFTRTVMNSNNIDYTSNTNATGVEALWEMLGYGAATNSIWELEGSDCIVVVNTNLTEEYNIVSLPIKRAVKEGAKLIVIDSREVELTRYAHVWLRPKPGTELLLLGAILKEILYQGFERREWLHENCEGLEAFRGILEDLDMDVIVEETGIPRSDIDEFVRMYGPSESSSIVYSLDNVPEDLRKDCVYALVTLALLTGNIGKVSSGIYPLFPGANAQGAWDMGCVPTLLPGHMSLVSEEARSTVCKEWGAEIPKELGMGIRQLFGGNGLGQIDTMFIVGDGVGLGEDLSLLDSLKFLVVQDTFVGPLAQKADVVLPRVTFTEKYGTFTNLERRIQTLRMVTPIQKGNPKPESWTLCELALRMGVQGFDFESPDSIMEEAARVTFPYRGVSLQRLESEGRLIFRPDASNPLPTQVLYSDKEYAGIQWPCSDPDIEGTQVLYSEGFGDHKVQILPINFKLSSIWPYSQEGELLFTPGRVLLQTDRDMTIVQGNTNNIQRDEIIEVNPHDARALDLKSGDQVEVSTKSGNIKGKLALRDDILPGVISCTFLFGELMVGLETSKNPDRMSRVPGLETTSARLSKIPIEG